MFRETNKPALLAAVALVGTYAAARSLEPDGQAPAARPQRLRRTAKRYTGWRFWRHVLYRTYVEVNDDRLLSLAAGVVFFGLLAIFPAVTALVSSYALFAKASTINNHLHAFAGLMPVSAYSVIDEQVTRIVTSATGKLSFGFFFGFCLALWSANAGIKAIIDALNIVYGVKESRSFIKLNLVSLAFTVCALASLLAAIAAIVVLPIILSYLPLYGYVPTITTWMRWPALLLLAILGMAVLYRFGPDRQNPRWQFFTVGSVFAAAAWLGGSALLSWYLGSFADYDATYGSLGAGIGLMMWLWMTAIVVLVGAELNSEIYTAMFPDPLPDEGGIGKG
ncbi:MAG: YihY/virulence factor BrkB family protein [Pseudolabrys sp.]|nr:YihY/virulence factor BrkB family protein [Pseudolabrys sp.]